jgi:hypothetical protein
MDTKLEKDENTDYWYMRYQFARVFLLIASFAMLTSPIRDMSARFEMLNKFHIIVLSVHSLQIVLTIIYIFASFYNKNLLKYIEFGLII